MSAYFDSGFCVRKPSWHRQEVLLADYPVDFADARIKAGLTWDPEVRQTFQFYPVTYAALADTVLPDGGVWSADPWSADPLGFFAPLPKHKLIVRNDTEAVLGVVGKGYELFTNGALGEIADAFLGANGGQVKFETLISVNGGAQVCALVYLDEPYTVAGDNTETLPFLAIMNSHDGLGSCKAIATQVRVVCWNTYRAAEMEGERSGRQYTFRHTAGIHDRIEEAKKALAGARDDAKEWDSLAAELFGQPVDDRQFNHFLADFIPEPPADVVSDKVRNNIDTARATFRSLYLDSPTSEAHRGTALGLVDTAVEYLDHVRGYRNVDTYLGRTLLRPEPLKARAVKLARNLSR